MAMQLVVELLGHVRLEELGQHEPAQRQPGDDPDDRAEDQPRTETRPHPAHQTNLYPSPRIVRIASLPSFLRSRAT